jgi:hypothetical protein
MPDHGGRRAAEKQGGANGWLRSGGGGGCLETFPGGKPQTRPAAVVARRIILPRPAALHRERDDEGERGGAETQLGVIRSKVM